MSFAVASPTIAAFDWSEQGFAVAISWMFKTAVRRVGLAALLGSLLLGGLHADWDFSQISRQSQALYGDVRPLWLICPLLLYWICRVWLRTTRGTDIADWPALQEWAAGNRRMPPLYEVIDRSGPDHAARFTVRVTVRNVGQAEATASSKGEAERLAAKAFLDMVVLLGKMQGITGIPLAYVM